MRTPAAPRMFLGAIPPPWWKEALLTRLKLHGVADALGRTMIRADLLHQSLSDRISQPSTAERDALLRVGERLVAHACSLEFNRVEGPAPAAGRTHCTLRAHGTPKAFTALLRQVQGELANAGLGHVATGVTPHMTLSYNAARAFDNIPLEPAMPWTIDAVCLLLGGGDPYGYEIIGRWPLLPELNPPVLQPALF